MKNNEQKIMTLFVLGGIIVCFLLYLLVFDFIFTFSKTAFSIDLLSVLISESPLTFFILILPLLAIFGGFALGKQKIKLNFLRKTSRILQAKTEEQFITINKYQDILAAASNETDQAIIILNRTGQIELVNKTFQNIFEFNYDSIIGKRLDFFFNEANLNMATLLSIKEKTTTKKTFSVEFSYQNDTSKSNIQFVGKPILNYNGEIEGLVLIGNRPDAKLNKMFSISKLA